MSENNNFFSNTNPDLISSKSLNDLEKLIISDSKNIQIAGKGTLIDSSFDFYKKFIQPNILPILIIVLFVGFIIYRYMTRKTDNKSVSETNNVNNLNNLNNLNNVENFDPNKSVNDPTQTQLELSETPLHADLDNVINQFVQDKEIDEILNDDSLYEDVIHRAPEGGRAVYRGAKNKWDGYHDDLMEHPYGYDNNYIESTNEMLNFATRSNKDKIDEVAKRLFS
jgi:hypothetical protein